ncbi:GNAT family N-acetyltransferase [Maridesulfovibrio sp.]|uniref:lipid II:glycine glycyltransferase FemX n=1 Tax=Maridesulfovibrio sp. TaxID=2795000 RepID=UPI002AA80BC2|nr:GNAT family N-acetyltransferase [Maridesulfovibrio sp.]
MSIKIECTNEAPFDWDSWNRSTVAHSSYYQSSSWAKMLKETEEAKPYYVRIYKNGFLHAQGLIMKRYYYNLFTGKKKVVLPYIECLFGPICKVEADSSVYTAFLKLIKKIAYRNIATNIQYIPCYMHKLPRFDKTEVLMDNGFVTKKWGTFLVDLAPDEELIFKKISSRARNRVRKAGKMGVSVRRMETYEEFANIFIPTLQAAKKEQGFVAYPAHEALWSDSKEGYHYYVAYADDTPLGCIGLIVHNGVSREISSGILGFSVQKKYPAQDILHWTLITESKRLGAKYYDLAGVNPSPEEKSKDASILFFKKKWGGSYLEYPMAKFDLIPKKDKLAKIAAKLLS